MHQLGGIMRAEFDIQIFTVTSDGMVSQTHPVGQFGKRIPFYNQLQQFHFASGEFQYIMLAFPKCDIHLLT